MKSLIQKLVETISPSGYEQPIRNLIQAEIRPHKGEVDALGNLIVKWGEGSAKGKRVMLSAHMDEIGIIATHIDQYGFIRFTTIGGVRPQMLLGSRVRFLNGTAGVIGGEKLDTADKIHNFEKLFIDVGATNPKDCPIHIGDVAGFYRTFSDFGKRYVAKSMDDRIGVAVLIDVLKRLKTSPHQIFFVFSTQEEVGLRGATTAAFSVDPEIGISVDVTLTGDTPKCATMAVSLGKGPAIKVRDGGMLADPKIINWMTETAKKAKIPYQLEILEGGTTDARVMQTTRGGVPAGCISIPCRYVHSPSEMVDAEDVENAVKLFIELLSHPIQL
jgi:tetrahedral aminopeptidase